MKKLIIIFCAILYTTSLSAQFSKSTIWMVRAGAATNMFTGTSYQDTKLKMSYAAGVEFYQPVALNWYWGSGLLFGSRGYEKDISPAEYPEYQNITKKSIAHSLQIPLYVGYKHFLTNKLAIDGHLGGFFSADYRGRKEVIGANGIKEINMEHWDDYRHCDGGVMVGVGLWYGKFNLDVTYQKGFAHEYFGLENKTKGSAGSFMVRLGYAFK